MVNRKRKITDEKIEQVKQLAEKGFKQQEIAKKANIGGSTVSAIKQGGFTFQGYRDVVKRWSDPNSSKKSKKEKKEENEDSKSVDINQKLIDKVKVLMEVGEMSGNEVAERVGVSDTTIYNIRNAGYDYEEYREELRRQREEYLKRKREEEKKKQKQKEKELKKKEKEFVEELHKEKDIPVYKEGAKFDGENTQVLIENLTKELEMLRKNVYEILLQARATNETLSKIREGIAVGVDDSQGRKKKA